MRRLRFLGIVLVLVSILASPLAALAGCRHLSRGISLCCSRTNGVTRCCYYFPYGRIFCPTPSAAEGGD